MRLYTISTGQASQLCSVTRDTVLKWVKRGKVQAIRTAGGHFRINEDSLKPYFANNFIDEQVIDKPVIEEYSDGTSFCWEYHSSGGDVKDGCRECMVFKTRAEKCYLMAGLGKGTGFTGTFCKSNCYDCEYFNNMYKSDLNVLVVTENKELSNDLKRDIRGSITLKSSICEYDTSYIVQDFRPDFIIVDETLVKTQPDDLCRHLINDPRIHGAQIVLAISGTLPQERLLDGICATINTPFTSCALEDCIDKLQKNLLGKRN